MRDPKQPNNRLKGHMILTYGECKSFAKAAGLSPAFVSRVINGHVRLPPEERVRWARLLRVDSKAIFPGREPR